MTMAMAQHVWGEVRWIQSFGGETCKKEPLRSPRHRWKDNIKMDQELDWCVWGGGGGMDWIDQTRSRDRW
jgi:hypothetical protein